MIYSRKYSRNFIPLKQDNTSYNLDFKPAIGRCLIEIKDGKGKVSVYAQGIKPNNEYNVELMCFQKGTLKNANIGILSVDEMGKGEIKADFDPENVLNTGNKIEDFNIVALIVNGLDKVVSSLVGYVGNEVNWKNKYIIPKHNLCCPNNDNMPDCNMPQVPSMPEIPTERPAPSQPGCNIPQAPSAPEIPVEKPVPSQPGCNIPQAPSVPEIPVEKPVPSQPGCNIPQAPSVPEIPIEKPAPSQPGCNIPQAPSMPEIPMPSQPQPAYSELEQGLIEKEQGLIEREKGLFDKEQGLIQRDQNLNSPVDLADFEKSLWEKEQGLLQKEQGLFEKEKGLFEKEKALNQGYLPSDADMALRGRELELIEWEKQLINHEEKLIQKEQNILDRQNPTSCDLEIGLREKQQGLLERELGLLEREKGLIAKEEGLFEKEQGIRDRNNGIKERENALNPPKNNNSAFKDMLDKLKGEVYNYENSVYTENNVSENLDIDYIKFKNMPLSPFKTQNENISWFRIAPYELSAFGRETEKYANNPFVYSCYKKYNHLMIGIKNKDGVESYILGIPCQYEAKFSMKNFENFVPLDENISVNNIKNGEYGYRLFNI